MSQNKIDSAPENWENGLLGNDPEFLEQAAPEVEPRLMLRLRSVKMQALFVSA